MCAEFEVRAIGARGAKGGNGIGNGTSGTTKAAWHGRDDHGVDVEALMKGGVACKGHKLEGGDGSKRLAPRGRRAAFGSLIVCEARMKFDWARGVSGRIYF
jgi:hypothetical protein